jgi:hypothetical protein
MLAIVIGALLVVYAYLAVEAVSARWKFKFQFFGGG